MEKIYDVLILGGGVAGISASIYAKRAGKSVLLIEKSALAGQVNELPLIENFPSQEKIDGFSLANKFINQVKDLNVEIVYDIIDKADVIADIKILSGKREQYKGKNLIIATGLKNIELGLNEKKYLGKGVSYCAICDGNFFKNKPVCVVSKQGSGIAEANILSKICSSVTVLDLLDMSVYAKYNKNEKIKVLSNVKIVEITGDNLVEGVKVIVGDKEHLFNTSAVFIVLGKVPASKLFKHQIKLDDKGYILTDEYMQTSAKGVYAVGDVRAGVLKQIVTACNDGAIAGQQIN